MVTNTKAPTCDKCGAKMILLLFSAVCDRCDSNSSASQVNGGVLTAYIASHLRRSGGKEYLFATREGAETWGRNYCYASTPVHKVQTLFAIEWGEGAGGMEGFKCTNMPMPVYSCRPDKSEEYWKTHESAWVCDDEEA